MWFWGMYRRAAPGVSIASALIACGVVAGLGQGNDLAATAPRSTVEAAPAGQAAFETPVRIHALSSGASRSAYHGSGITTLSAWQDDADEPTVVVDGSIWPERGGVQVKVRMRVSGASPVLGDLRVSTRADGTFSARLPVPTPAPASVLVTVEVASVAGNFQSYPDSRMRVALVESRTLSTAGSPDPESSSFTFVSTDALGRPARWDTCRPLEYRVNPAGMDGEKLQVIDEAFQQIEQATGLDFVDAGVTDEVPSASVPIAFEDGTIVIALAGPSTERLMAGEVLGAAGFSTTPTMDGLGIRISSGWVLIDGNETLEPGFASGRSFGGVVLHELGHVLNLDHVLDPSQVMFAYLDWFSPGTYGRGDRAGLAKVGAAGGCQT